jgi:tRNA pseudouridine55 synthase
MKNKSSHHGLLLIDKPTGISSFDVIRTLRKSIKIKKMGHTGTLDPMASGLLIICVGEGTKLVQYLTADEKAYEAVLSLGFSTDTYDAQGQEDQVSSPEDIQAITQTHVEDALTHFRGDQFQIPPLFSAIKVKGERLYQKARRGETIDDLESLKRPITIHQLDLLEYNENTHTIRLFVRCSKGTYIRSLVVDLARKLGVYGHLSYLRRTQCGAFHLDQAALLDQVDLDNLPTTLLPLESALAHWPHITVSSQQEEDLSNGKEIKSTACPPDFLELQRGCAFTEEGRLIALVQPSGLDSDQRQGIKVLRGIRT